MAYRHARLPESRGKARSYDPPYDGAMFAWESAATGAETYARTKATIMHALHAIPHTHACNYGEHRLTRNSRPRHHERCRCPTWADTGRLEQHITGDVALAATLKV